MKQRNSGKFKGLKAATNSMFEWSRGGLALGSIAKLGFRVRGATIKDLGDILGLYRDTRVILGLYGDHRKD